MIRALRHALPVLFVTLLDDRLGLVKADPNLQFADFTPFASRLKDAGVDWVLSVVGLSASDSDDHLVKRVIGLPGDTVECCNPFGQMSVDDVPLDEPYLRLGPGVTRASGSDFHVTVPKDSLWVMGDNRYDSADSRRNMDKPGKGFVPIENVVGRAFIVSWPINHWAWLDNYPIVFPDARDETP